MRYDGNTNRGDFVAVVFGAAMLWPLAPLQAEPTLEPSAVEFPTVEVESTGAGRERARHSCLLRNQPIGDARHRSRCAPGKSP